MPLPATSPLTELLHKTKSDRQALLAMREYESVKQLREECFEKAEEMKAGLQAEVRARHATERRRLARARQAALQAVHETVQKEMQAIEQQWEERRDAYESRQQQRYEQHEKTVRTREDARPVVLSSYVRDLQQSEVKLASLHQYDESAQVRKKISHLEVQERSAVESLKEARIQRALDLRKSIIDQDDSNFRAKVKNELQLALSRARHEEERVKNKFDHIERDMRHAHSLELRKNPLQAAYERPAFIKSRGGDETSPVGPQPVTSAAASMRGTEYLARTQGSKLEVPSLCHLYKFGVPEHLRRSGESLRLGADPTVPRLDHRGLIDLALPPLAATNGASARTPTAPTLNSSA